MTGVLAVETSIILCSADLWELHKRARDLERIAGVHVRTKPFDLDDMSELIEGLLGDESMEQALA